MLLAHVLGDACNHSLSPLRCASGALALPLQEVEGRPQCFPLGAQVLVLAFDLHDSIGYVLSRTRCALLARSSALCLP